MTQDLLSNGERRGGGSTQAHRWYAALTGAVALATVLAALARSGDHAGPPPPTRSAAPARSAGSADLDRPTNSRLLVAGDRLVRLDVDGTSARQLPVPGLVADHYVSSLTSRRGATVVLVSGRGERARRPGTAWAVPDGGGTPVILGWADQVVAALAPDRVWLLTTDAAANGGRSLLRELDVRGRLVTPPYAVGLAGRLVADASAGFLVERRMSRASTLDVVDRRSGRLRERVARRAMALAAGPHQVAWVDPACHLRCTVQVEDLRTGFRVVVSILDVGRYGGAMSAPDDRRLAFTAVAVITPGGPAVPVLLVAGVDDPGISVVTLPSAVTAGSAGAALPRTLTWSANGQWVFLATSTVPQRLLAWRLDSAAAATVRFPIAGVEVVAPT
ncbi:MAG: hypothetical protein ACR2JO_12565 [Mycobacteriales bacterium]